MIRVLYYVIKRIVKPLCSFQLTIVRKDLGNNLFMRHLPDNVFYVHAWLSNNCERCSRANEIR